MFRSMALLLPVWTALPAAAALPGTLRPAAACAQPGVVLVRDRDAAECVRYAIRRVAQALERKGLSSEIATRRPPSPRLLLVAGRCVGQGPAAALIAERKIEVPAKPESFVLRKVARKGGDLVLAAAPDDRGLVYALLEVAVRIGWAEDPERPFAHVRDTAQSPGVVERALSVFTFHRRTFERRFHDPAYWERYLDTLIENRFNTFVLIFGYENWGYFAPPYPFLFDVPGFPEVRVVGLAAEEQERNLAFLKRLVRQCHKRGLRFTLGIWDHIYRGGVQGPRELASRPSPGVVWGLTEENLVDYNVAGLRRLLEEIPDIDRIQFRMHGESGLKRGEMERFWTAVYGTVRSVRPDLPFDARAKNLPDRLIDKALEAGLRLRITTKYWAEQMGLPFHPTHINRQNQFDRRHGYADLLRYPKRYPVHWRLWNGGTTRLLLWGDPDYVRRFAQSTHLYDGEGFEVNEPLATKMQDQPHDEEPFAIHSPAYRWYDYEFERYWHFFQVFGRVGYSVRADPEVWRREFSRRFGAAGGRVERGLHVASRVLPRIVAVSFPYHRFPMTRGWVEKQRREDLPVYAKAPPSDTEQFLGPWEAARRFLEGRFLVRRGPTANAAWFEKTAREVLSEVEAARAAGGGKMPAEFQTALADLEILAHLAEYHAARQRAAFAWSLFRQAGDLNLLEDAVEHEERAVGAWRRLVSAAGDVYARDLRFGRRSAGLCGHWRDELETLETELRSLRREVARWRPPAPPAGTIYLAHVPVRRIAPGRGLELRATAASPAGLREVVAVFRAGPAEERLPLELHANYRYRGASRRPLEPGRLHYRIEASAFDGTRARLPQDGWYEVMVTADRTPPEVDHTPLRSAPASRPLAIRARVRDPSGIARVTLRYRSVTQFQDYKALEMHAQPGDAELYEAVVPAADVDPAWDFMYFFEVLDRAGNGSIHPDLERETPYVIVRLER